MLRDLRICDGHSPSKHVGCVLSQTFNMSFDLTFDDSNTTGSLSRIAMVAVELCFVGKLVLADSFLILQSTLNQVCYSSYISDFPTPGSGNENQLFLFLPYVLRYVTADATAWFGSLEEWTA